MIVVGAGLVGRRTAQVLAAASESPVGLVSRRPHGAGSPPEGVESLGLGEMPAAHRVVVLATESAAQPELARQYLAAGAHVVTTADEPRSVERLLTLDASARAVSRTLVVGAAYAPGLSTLLVSHLATTFDEIFDIRTARFGTGGPACAREHHRSMAGRAHEVRDRRLRRLRGGTGRSLVWFPEPIGGADCYRADLCEPLLLRRVHPDVRRIQALQAATRRDRLTARLPMLRPPHAEGLVGGVAVEVRGVAGGAVEHRMLAATGPQATGAAHTAAHMATVAAAGELNSGVTTAADVPDFRHALRVVAEGVGLWTYDGSASGPPSGSSVQVARKWIGPRTGTKNQGNHRSPRGTG